MSFGDTFDLRAFPARERLDAAVGTLVERAASPRSEIVASEGEFTVLVEVPVEGAAGVPALVDPEKGYDAQEVEGDLDPPRDRIDYDAAEREGCLVRAIEDGQEVVRVSHYERFMRPPSTYEIVLAVQDQEPDEDLPARVEVDSNAGDNRAAWPVAHAFALALAEALGLRPDPSLD